MGFFGYSSCMATLDCDTISVERIRELSESSEPFPVEQAVFIALELSDGE